MGIVQHNRRGILSALEQSDSLLVNDMGGMPDARLHFAVRLGKVSLSRVCHPQPDRSRLADSGPFLAGVRGSERRVKQRGYPTWLGKKPSGSEGADNGLLCRHQAAPQINDRRYHPTKGRRDCQRRKYLAAWRRRG